MVPSTDGNHSSVTNAMEGLQQTHHPWLWYSPMGQRPPCSAVGSALPCVSQAGDAGLGTGGLEGFGLSRGVWWDTADIFVQGPPALPGLVPWTYREEAETTEPSLTWHNSWFLALQGMDSSLFPMSHHSQSQWAPGCRVSVFQKEVPLNKGFVSNYVVMQRRIQENGIRFY